MERKEFLTTIGIGTAAFLCQACFTGCTPDDSPTAPTNVDLTIDLDTPENSGLKLTGSALVKNGVIIAHTAASGYVAVSAVCTHEGATVQYQSSNNRFNCPRHQSNFQIDGAVINGPAGSPLQSYKTELNGSLLRVFS